MQSPVEVQSPTPKADYTEYDRGDKRNLVGEVVMAAVTQEKPDRRKDSCTVKTFFVFQSVK